MAYFYRQRNLLSTRLPPAGIFLKRGSHKSSVSQRDSGLGRVNDGNGEVFFERRAVACHTSAAEDKAPRSIPDKISPHSFEPIERSYASATPVRL